VPSCDFRAGAETEDEILAKAAGHAKDAHGPEPTPELVEKVKGAIEER
jgi:predicted small metal-binding protein